MNLQNLVENLITDTWGSSSSEGFGWDVFAASSLGQFLPELAVCTAIVAILVFRLFSIDRWIPSYWVALGGALIAFAFALTDFARFLTDPVRQEIFTGLLVYDEFTAFFRLFLLLFVILVIALTVLSGIPDNDDGPDFYTLLLGSVIGMMLMASANHLLILFLAIEMASVPSYVMVGFLKGRKDSSEAALKFVVYGAGAAGVMLYGTSLLAGIVGTGDLSQISVVLNQIAAGTSGLSDGTVRTVSLGIMLLLVGIAFKLSLVPFHFWCPDAFQGASAEVAGYLSVASKAGAFALLVRVCLSLSGPAPGAMSEVLLYFGIGLGVVASITATFGNLAAYTQTNVKRLLAYSTIAHAGYMLMAVAALLVVLNGEGVADRQELAMRCIEGLLYYLSVYLFMNLGAFAIVALIRNQIYSEEISDYNGLASQTPALCICMLICLFSLVGMPPFGGFVGKLMIFSSLFQSGAIHWSMYVVLCVGGLNTVFSLIYYIRVLKAMFMGDRPEGARRADIPLNSSPGFYVAMVTAPVVLLGVFVHLLSNRVYHLAKYIIQ